MTVRTHTWWLRLLLLMGLLPASTASAQSVGVVGGSVQLTISAASAGSDPTPVTDSSTYLSWSGTKDYKTKVTVETLCPGQSFSLFVQPVYRSGYGTLGAEVELTHGMLPADIVTNIDNRSGFWSFLNNGTAWLSYRAEATANQGNSNDQGDDAHTVTYTITAQ